MDTTNTNSPDSSAPQAARWDPVADYDQRYRDKRHRAIFGDSGYSNYGYWDASTQDAVQACDALVDKLIATFPDSTGTVLDVACGCGGSTKRLTRHFIPGEITAINISKFQTDSTQSRVPGSRCLQMDAVRMEFEAASFQHILCVEAACCFRTRLRFFKEAYRILKPGGSMALTDILIETPPEMVQVQARVSDLEEIPLANRVNAEVYRDMLEVVGFKSVKLESVLNQTLRAFDHFSLGWISHFFNKLEASTAQQMIMHGKFLAQCLERNTQIKDYIIVSAQK